VFNKVRKRADLIVCRSTVTPVSIGAHATPSERCAVQVFEHLRSQGIEVTLATVTQVIREWRSHGKECSCGWCDLAHWVRPDAVWWALRDW
jgi:hypothetical protein